MNARFYETMEGERVRCVLCPHRCVISPDRTGICGVRKNSGGKLSLPYSGKISSLALDPVEKKPLYHFHPGKKILSCGFIGCSFRCPFCQNYAISQNLLASTREMTPAALIGTAVDYGSFAIAYTYSEPTVHLEFVLETAARSREAGLKNVLVSNGFLNREPAEELCSIMDAANIDLKSYSTAFYRKELGGDLQPVLDFLAIAASRTHLEVTTLVIPGKNDSPDEITAIAAYVASLNPDIPLHLSAYHPTYRYTIPPTETSELMERAEIARERLRYVYLGNVHGGSDTFCPSCGVLLIARRGYGAENRGIENGSCRSCGTAIPVRGL